MVRPMKHILFLVVMVAGACSAPAEEDSLPLEDATAFDGVVAASEDIAVSPEDGAVAPDDAAPSPDDVSVDPEDGVVTSEDGGFPVADVSPDTVEGEEGDAWTAPAFPGEIPALVPGDAVVGPSPGGLSVQPGVALNDALEAFVVFTGTSAEDTNLAIWGKRDEGEVFALHEADGQLRNEPSVCALAGGGFAVVWSVDTSGTEDPSLQIGYTVVGPEGAAPEQRVVTDREGNHWLGHVSCSADGGFVIAGVRSEAADPTFEAFAQQYDAAGISVGQATTLNMVPELSESQPVAGATSGTLWTAWTALDGGSWVRRAFMDEGPIELVAGEIVGAALGADHRVDGALVAVTIPGPDLQLRWLPEAGDPSDLVPLPQDGALSRHTAALALLERSDKAAAIYLTLEGENSRVLVTYVGVEGASPVAVATGQLPPYTPAIAYRGGALVAAWTEKDENNQFTVRMQRW